jgi:heterotetrameric sarcosine oxidase delta subunit
VVAPERSAVSCRERGRETGERSRGSDPHAGRGVVAVALRIPCPHCGLREYTEFTFGGELRPTDSPDLESDFDRVYHRANVAGEQQERWFHAAGCRRWMTLTRDTVRNVVR